MLPIAREAVEQARKENAPEREIQEVQRRIDRLTANLDQMYRDRLNGLLAETDFGRIYHTLQVERSVQEKNRHRWSAEGTPLLR